ncbi:MAG TPA: TIGR02996 domain-containing protein [Gemmataceae bacterium]|nr:TIGR02996 domain-containing protein [Gemmataceae bacterium]
MSDRDALVRAILEAPDDDAPRLIFADWLEENGWQPEAVQLRFAVANREGVWWRLATAMLQASYPPSGVPVWTPYLVGRGEVSRGFVRSVELEVTDFLEAAADLFALQPIGQVRLTGARPERIFWAGAWGWERSAGRRPAPSHVLPKPLYDSLDLTTGARWPSVEAAEEQLSRACVRYGRRLAGLLPL